MILYHGSAEVVENPVFGKGSVHNDYGQGFYCTKNIELAKEWACPVLKDGFVNKYNLELRGLKTLYLNKDGYNILNWIALLLKNRTFVKRSPISIQANEYILKEFLPDISGFDVICGYRADDSYFAFANDFINNVISVNQLAQAMKLGNLGEQYVLKSQKAFDKIEFISYEIVNSEIYNIKRTEREGNARKAYLENHGADFQLKENDLFVRDIIQERVKNDDPRLR